MCASRRITWTRFLPDLEQDCQPSKKGFFQVSCKLKKVCASSDKAMQETVRQLTVFYDICDATRRFLGSGSNHWLCDYLMPRIRLTCPRPRSLESCRRCWAALPQPAAGRPDAGSSVADAGDGSGLAGESPLSRLVIDALRFEIQARRRPAGLQPHDVRRAARERAAHPPHIPRTLQIPCAEDPSRSYHQAREGRRRNVPPDGGSHWLHCALARNGARSP